MYLMRQSHIHDELKNQQFWSVRCVRWVCVSIRYSFVVRAAIVVCVGIVDHAQESARSSCVNVHARRTPDMRTTPATGRAHAGYSSAEV